VYPRSQAVLVPGKPKNNRQELPPLLQPANRRRVALRESDESKGLSLALQTRAAEARCLLDFFARMLDKRPPLS
jgi:hypothetical protein